MVWPLPFDTLHALHARKSGESSFGWKCLRNFKQFFYRSYLHFAIKLLKLFIVSEEAVIPWIVF